MSIDEDILDVLTQFEIGFFICFIDGNEFVR